MTSRVRNILLGQREKLFVLLDQALVSGVNFVVGVLLARWMGIEAYGLFALGWMLVLFVSGLQQAFFIAPLYALTSKQEDREQWFAQIRGVQLLGSLLSSLIVWALIRVAWMFQTDWIITGADWSIALLVGVFQINDLHRRIAFVRHQPRYVLLMDVVGYGLQPFGLWVLFQMNALTIPAAALMITSFQFLAVLPGVIEYPSNLDRSVLREILPKLWNYGRYLLGTAVLQWFSGNYFIVAAGALIGPAAVGAVRIAQNIMGILHVLFIAMENIVPVRASEQLQSSGLPSMMRYIKRISLQALAPTLVLLGMIALFREEILTMLYGVGYLAYDGVLLAFCGIYVFVFLGTQFRFVIRTIERNQLIFWSYIITTILSLLTAYPIVEQFQLYGVVIGLAWMQVVSLVFYSFYLKNELKWLFK